MVLSPKIIREGSPFPMYPPPPLLKGVFQGCRQGGGALEGPVPPPQLLEQ